MNGKPLKHIQKSFGARGRLLGAWATLTDGTRTVGALMELSELAISPQWSGKDDRWTQAARTDVWEAIKIGAYGPFWAKAPGRMGEKCVFAHLTRRMVPDLESLYLPGEVGGEHDEEAAKQIIDITPRAEPVAEIATDAEVVVDLPSPDPVVETPNPTPADATAGPETPPPVSDEPSIDERMMRGMQALGPTNRKIAQAITIEAFKGKEPGAKLTTEEKEYVVRTGEAARKLVAIDGGETARGIAATESPLPLAVRFLLSLEEFERSNG